MVMKKHRKWVDSDDSDGGVQDLKGRPHQGNSTVAVQSVEDRPDHGASQPSRGPEASFRLASSLLIGSSDDESGNNASRSSGHARATRTTRAWSRLEHGPFTAAANRKSMTGETAEGKNDAARQLSKAPRSRIVVDSQTTLPVSSSLQRVRQEKQTMSPHYSNVRKARMNNVSKFVSNMLRHSSPVEGSPLSMAVREATADSDDSDGPAKRRAMKRAPDVRGVDSSNEDEDQDEDQDEDKSRRPTAAEVAESMRRKKKTQMAITDCLKQNKLRVPVLRVLARSHEEVEAPMEACPTILSVKTSSAVRGKIVFVGTDVRMVRPAAAVGAQAIVVLSGDDIPMPVDVEEISGDVKIPIVAVSKAGMQQLRMGEVTSLMFSNSMGLFSPEETQLLRPKYSHVHTKREMISAENAALDSYMSKSIQTLTVNSDSDSSPMLKARRPPVMHNEPKDGRMIDDRTLQSSLEKTQPKEPPASEEKRIQIPHIQPSRTRAAWETFVDSELKESFEVLESPRRDATMASIFGMVTVESEETVDTEHLPLSDPCAGVFGSSNERKDSSKHVLAPMVTVDVVSVTPGMSVSNVYNEMPNAAGMELHKHLYAETVPLRQAAEKQKENPEELKTVPEGGMEEGSQVAFHKESAQQRDFVPMEQADSRASLQKKTDGTSLSNTIPPSDLRQAQDVAETQFVEIRASDLSAGATTNQPAKTGNLVPDTAETTIEGRLEGESTLFDQDPAAMASMLARLEMTAWQRSHEKMADSVFEGIVERMRSQVLMLRHDAIVRLRELCRYKSSALVKKIVQRIFAHNAVRQALRVTLEPQSYHEGTSEIAVLKQAKLSAAACFRHLAVDSSMGRIMATDQEILGLFGRILNQEAVDGIRHTVAGCIANLSVHDDENRSLVCESADILEGLQLMLENVGVLDHVKHFETALAALSNLSLNATKASTILEHVQVKSLVEAIVSGSPKAQVRAVRIVRNLLRVPDCYQRVSSTEGIREALHNLLLEKHVVDPEAKSRALEALASMNIQPPTDTAQVPKTPDSGQSIPFLSGFTTVEQQRLGGKHVAVHAVGHSVKTDGQALDGTLAVRIIEAQIVGDVQASGVTAGSVNIMMDVPGELPKYGKAKRLTCASKDAAFQWHETFTFSLDRSQRASARLRVSIRVETSRKTEIGDLPAFQIADLEDGVESDTWLLATSRHNRSSTIAMLRTALVYSESEEDHHTEGLDGVSALGLPSMNTKFLDGILQNEADMSKISMQSGVGGTRILSPGIAFTPQLVRTNPNDGAEMRHEEVKEEGQKMGRIIGDTKHKGDETLGEVGKKQGTISPKREAAKRGMNSDRLNHSACRDSENSLASIDGDKDASHSNSTKPEFLPDTQRDLLSLQNTEDYPRENQAPKNEIDATVSIECMYDYISRMESVSNDTLRAFSSEPQLLNALLPVVIKYGAEYTQQEGNRASGSVNTNILRFLTALRLLRDLCRIQPDYEDTVAASKPTVELIFALLRPLPMQTMDIDAAEFGGMSLDYSQEPSGRRNSSENHSRDLSVEIRSLAADLLAMCATTEQLQEAIRSVRDKWWYSPGDHVA